MDRIDLRVELAAPTLDELGPPRRAPESETIAAPALRERVARARARQHVRQSARRNADLEADELDTWAPIDAATRPLLARAAKLRGLSARAVQSLRRVSRTLADLDDAVCVGVEHLARAIALRSALA